MIRSQRLRPGDVLPSDRELAKRFRVAHSTVRYANDLLCRQGLLQRRHGKGTFLAEASSAKAGGKRVRRLGLLYVDLPSRVSTYSQLLTFGVQEAALRAGYEVLIEQMGSEYLVQGKAPEMVRRRSVDALLLDGRVREHHIRFLEDQPIPYVVLGTCPVGKDVPQVRLNAERLIYEIARELLQAGRSTVWLDVEISRIEQHYMGFEMLRGYERAMREFGSGSRSLNLCSLWAQQVAAAAAKLVEAGLEHAAIIVADWAAALLPAALALKSPRPQDLLIVPLPYSQLCQSLHGPNVAEWSQHMDAEHIAQRAVGSLIPVLEGRTDEFPSVSWEADCKLIRSGDSARMELRWEWERMETFFVERYGNRVDWRRRDSTIAPAEEDLAAPNGLPVTKADQIEG